MRWLLAGFIVPIPSQNAPSGGRRAQQKQDGNQIAHPDMLTPNR